MAMSARFGRRVLAAAPAGLRSRAVHLKASLADVPESMLANKRVLVRVDFNVPQDKATGEITDTTRLEEALPTIRHLQQAGSRVVLCSHLGRPKGERNEKFSLAPIATKLSALLDTPVNFSEDCIGAPAEATVAATGSGEVCLLENLRFYAEEEKNDEEFCKSLSTLADFYVNDAFGTAHRAHASTAGVTQFVSGGAVSGFLLEKELKFLMGAVAVPKRPFAAIVGGAKVSTKLPVLDSLLGKCDKIIIGGAMMFTFFKARGLPVGSSLVEDDQLEIATKLVEQAEKKGVKLVFPVDAVVAKESWKEDPAAYNEGVQVTDDESIPDGWMGLDIGPKSIELLQAEIGECQTVVWNGPMGAFELDDFAAGTAAVANTMAEITANGATTIVGGGDSVAAVKQMGLGPAMSHVSTGGGASLELLEGKVLPGVAALDEKEKYT